MENEKKAVMPPHNVRITTTDELKNFMNDQIDAFHKNCSGTPSILYMNALSLGIIWAVNGTANHDTLPISTRSDDPNIIQGFLNSLGFSIPIKLTDRLGKGEFELSDDLPFEAPNRKFYRFSIGWSR